MPVWEIYTYGNGEFLSFIFNGIVALMGDGNFTTLMRLASIFGLFWVSIKAALYRGPVEWTYLIWFVLIYSVLFVPKVDVVIVDRLDPSQTRVVANVPWGLGTFAGATARIGDWFTRGTEAVMSQPDDLKYHRNGVVFGSSLVEAASQYAITDGRFAGNMSEFMRQCVFYDILLRRYTWTDILEAEDTWEFVKKNTASASRAFAYTAADGSQSILPCQTGAVSPSALQGDWDAEVARAAKLYGKRFNPGLNMTDAAAKLMADLPMSYDYLAGISKSGGDIIRQNMMANVFRRSFTNAAAAADAGAAAQDFALAQAEQQQLATYQTLGKLAGKLLPMLKNIYEGLLYGMFPFLFLVFMLPIGTKVFLTYLKNIVWLQLWAPLYAILNLLMTLGAKHFSMAAAAQLGGQALSLATHSGLAAVNVETSVIAGYIGISIPLIAYGLVSGGQMALTQLASQVASVAQSAASQAGSTAATGNINLANLGAYNTGMFKSDTNALTNYGQGKYNDSYGASHDWSRGGVHGQTNLKTDVGVSAELAETLQAAKKQSLSELDQAAQTAGHRYAEGLAANLGKALDLTRTTGWGTTKTDGWSQQDATAYKEMSEHVQQLIHKLADGETFSQKQAEEIVLKAYTEAYASASASGKFDVGVFKAELKTGLEAGLRAEGSHKEADEIARTASAVAESADADVIRRGVEALRNYASSTTVQNTERGSNDLGAALRSDLQDTAMHEKNWQDARTRLTAAQEEWSKVTADSQSISANVIPELIDDLRRSGHSQVASLTSDPTRSRELAQVLGLAAKLKFGDRVDGIEAARTAIESVTNPTYGQIGFAMGQRAETTAKVDNRDEAVDQADRENRHTVAGEGAVRRAAAGNEHTVLHKPLSAHSPYAGAAALGLDPDKLGQVPLTDRKDLTAFKDRVVEETDHETGKGTTTVSADEKKLQEQTAAATGDVEGRIADGKRNTEGFTPAALKPPALAPDSETEPPENSGGKGW
ncbi:conjugal transfer protein TraG N-terminal domain-containing protein [Sulfurivermis fontis]|uniref:conjugal transfer protein TraG N-terminal domain-containing protein n=1 Tax=Sulfurivermis fontis TaxID=1972068 RepID=UPI000FDA11B0|nr:conjugal transfer protein TraG N-terminal domain-containing protein [Sulfurivermis fontis]